MGKFITARGRFFVVVAGALLASVTGACSDGSTSTGAGASPVGRGSAACHTWQNALCTFAAKCSTLSRAACDEQARAITCSSDQLASDCASSLQAASCPAPPSGCDLRNLADPAPAIAACNEYLDAVCTADAKCGGPTLAECRATVATQVDCNVVVGYTLNFEACLRALETQACGAGLPDICSAVLLQ